MRRMTAVLLDSKSKDTAQVRVATAYYICNASGVVSSKSATILKRFEHLIYRHNAMPQNLIKLPNKKNNCVINYCSLYCSD